MANSSQTGVICIQGLAINTGPGSIREVCCLLYFNVYSIFQNRRVVVSFKIQLYLLFISFLDTVYNFIKQKYESTVADQFDDPRHKLNLTFKDSHKIQINCLSLNN